MIHKQEKAKLSFCQDKCQRYEKPTIAVFEMDMEGYIMSYSLHGESNFVLGTNVVVDETNADENGNEVW